MVPVEPRQPARTEDRMMHHNAAYVTGNRLAHRLPSASVRVTSQRSAVVTRTPSECKPRYTEGFFRRCPDASGMTLSLAEKFSSRRNDNHRQPDYTDCQSTDLSVATACTVANKAPSDRATGASVINRDPSSIKNSPLGLFIKQATACLSTLESDIQDRSLASPDPCSSFIHRGSIHIAQRR